MQLAPVNGHLLQGCKVLIFGRFWARPGAVPWVESVRPSRCIILWWTSNMRQMVGASPRYWDCERRSSSFVQWYHVGQIGCPKSWTSSKWCTNPWWTQEAFFKTCDSVGAHSFILSTRCRGAHWRKRDESSFHVLLPENSPVAWFNHPSNPMLRWAGNDG